MYSFSFLRQFLENAYNIYLYFFKESYCCIFLDSLKRIQCILYFFYGRLLLKLLNLYLWTHLIAAYYTSIVEAFTRYTFRLTIIFVHEYIESWNLKFLYLCRNLCYTEMKKYKRQRIKTISFCLFNWCFYAPLFPANLCLINTPFLAKYRSINNPVI